MAKIGYRIGDNHRVGASINGQHGHNYTIEESYNLSSYNWREADDFSKRRNANVFYEWTPESSFLSLLKTIKAHIRTTIPNLIRGRANGTKKNWTKCSTAVWTPASNA